ncbi:MAG: hypothetical protein A2729_03095 [Candidatus Buchananbacteria bacterium RIFCSPHIGHO2_01_FULL_39_14]|uniref:Uncharacterized protein n=2 Tax=Candidatus Buchananiibacteriota TaxID=1817903 RepID=A0A1G1YUP2_9BACT|nr:MAG: hypothetical protein A2729_03095 [Candidatus Buchananbacteria bacterium RIFCSPHIGHO2_01_FULL_39_14]OGY49017.1 MAG: hypothetical protein A3D39_01440 [Candidatus Buchananbacteria bacterium RIFCSPHIGHO2_02_FULL_39_17]OGY55979.1 MAG: hypothetical protein A2912_03285 [Candidatus Buchananbacteria bacterium RIFCSPLOWO2_01_FULL_40_23b]
MFPRLNKDLLKKITKIKKETETNSRAKEAEEVASGVKLFEKICQLPLLKISEIKNIKLKQNPRLKAGDFV